jgi:hypothetical protein
MADPENSKVLQDASKEAKSSGAEGCTQISSYNTISKDGAPTETAKLIEKAKSSYAKVLLECFKIGPSIATMKSSQGYVKIIEEDAPKKSEEEGSSEASKEETTDNDGKKESYHYTILESYLNLFPCNEEGESATPTADAPAARKEGGESSDSKESSTDISIGSSLKVRVGIHGEGYTDWTIAFSDKVPSSVIENAKTAIRSKKFADAYAIASKSIKEQGLFPLKATTYIYMKDDKHPIPPHMGHCTWGFDSGEKTGSNESAGTITLAVAPIDGNTNRPSESIGALQAVYNVVKAEDIMGGKAGELIAKAVDKLPGELSQGQGSDNKYYRSSDKEHRNSELGKANALHEFLSNLFPTSGTQKDFKKFIEIREWIKKQVEAGNITYDGSNVSGALEDTSKTFKPKGHLIYY